MYYKIEISNSNKIMNIQHGHNDQRDLQNEITDILDKSQCYCLNESIEGSFINMVQSNTNSYVKSMVDPQLLIQLFFRQCVTITHIEFETTTKNSCPKTIKLFTNRVNMGFDDASSLAPIETIRLFPNKNIHKFKLTKVPCWTKSNIVHLFVEDNYGAENTEIKNIKIYGSVVDDTDVSRINKFGCMC